ncbi:hypothetical protein ONO86_04554 [Micromonospora noduli]|nr:hypothetical protein ONO86_04554 [Micromonospora noduli]
MRVVDQQQRAVTAGHCVQPSQRGEITIDREDRLGHHHRRAAGSGRERGGYRVDVGVRGDHRLRAGDAAAVDQRRVVVRVGDEQRPRLDERPQRAEVGQVTGGEDQGTIGAQPAGQVLLQSPVRVGGAPDQARPGRPQPVRRQGRRGRRDDVRVGGQAEVVVAGQIGHLVVGRTRMQSPGEPGLRPQLRAAVERRQPVRHRHPPPLCVPVSPTPAGRNYHPPPPARRFHSVRAVHELPGHSG